MSNQPIARLGTLLLALGLSACAGAQGNAIPASGEVPATGNGDAATAPEAKRNPNGATTLAITLPPIHPKGVAIDWASLPNLLSSATQSVSGTIGKKSFGPIALSSAQSTCQTSSLGLVCTVTVDAAPGTSVPVALATYGKKTSANDTLAAGTVTLTIFKGQNNIAKPALIGIARSIGMSAEQGTLMQGFVVNDRMAIYGVDAAKAAIPSTTIVSADGTLQKKFDIAYAGPVTHAKSARKCCGDVASFVYDGLQDGTETITAAFKDFPNATETVTVQPGTQAVAPLLTAGSLSIQGVPATGKPKTLRFVSEFPLDADGNVVPARTFMPGLAQYSTPFSGEDASGNFWAGATRLSNRGAILGTIAMPAGFEPVHVDGKGRLYAFSSSAGQCILNEYSSGAFGTPKPSRQINMGACSDPSLRMAVDRAGDVFVILQSATPTINEYPPKGSGVLSPIRTLDVGHGAYIIPDLDTDAAGNLYALWNGPTPQLLQFAPGASTGTELLAGVKLQNFAVDDGGDIFGCVVASGPMYVLQYFAAGSNTPSRSISGSNTMLNCNPILVPRS